MVTTLSLLFQQIQDIEHRISEIYKIYNSNQVTLIKWENRMLNPTQVNALGYGEDLMHAHNGEEQWVSIIIVFEIIGKIDPIPICDYFNSPYIFIWTEIIQKEAEMYTTRLTIVIC